MALRKSRESNDPVDAFEVSGASVALSKLKNIVILLVCIGVFVELAGLPYLRVSYGPNDATYWSITGKRHAAKAEFGGAVPVIVLFPLPKPLWQYAGDAWSTVRQRAAASLDHS